jgi:hypothetical protein
VNNRLKSCSNCWRSAGEPTSGRPGFRQSNSFSLDSLGFARHDLR